MTWKEFKKEVDKRIEDSGYTDEVDVEWIEVGFPDRIRVLINRNDKTGKVWGLVVREEP
jgi:hypothetical protein